MKTLFLILFIFTVQIFGQWNLTTVYDTTGTNDSIFVDLGVDSDYLPLEYTEGSQFRAIAFEMHGTWTNDSMQVYAATNPDSTYYPVYYNGSLLYEVATTGNCFIAFNQQHYAGIRYLLFKLEANEAANRLYGIVKRQY